MREILFRGKRKHKEEWVEGNIIIAADGVFIMPNGSTVEFSEPDYHSQGMGCGLEDRNITDRYEAMRHGWECAIERCAESLPDVVEVIPETVGQYAFSLLNEVQTKIFDGDKLSLKDDAGAIIEVVVEWGMHRRQMGTGTIVDIPGFCLRKQDGLASFPIADNYIGRHDLEIIELIGNIHDNPETLLPGRG